MKRFLVTLAVAVVLALSAGSARADVETIGPVFVPMGVTVDIFFPNEFDLDHQKLLLFEGVAVANMPGLLAVSFDYLDLRGGVVDLPVPPFMFPVGPGVTNPILTPPIFLPFCPLRVSLHLTALDTDIQVQGQFTHECLVPEPSSVVLFGCGGMGCLLVARRAARRRLALAA